MGNETDGIIEKLFESSLQNYQKDLEESMKGSQFVFDSIDFLKVVIDSPDWQKNKKATINPKNNDDNCFQYALTVVLNYQEIEKKLSMNIEN